MVDTTNARGIYEYMYPPVGPINIPGLALNPANTGNPIIPMSMYMMTANVQSLGFKQILHKRIAKSPILIGITPIGIVMGEITDIKAENNAT